LIPLLHAPEDAPLFYRIPYATFNRRREATISKVFSMMLPQRAGVVVDKAKRECGNDIYFFCLNFFTIVLLKDPALSEKIVS
jgi:hypothetical protein